MAVFCSLLLAFCSMTFPSGVSAQGTFNFTTEPVTQPTNIFNPTDVIGDPSAGQSSTPISSGTQEVSYCKNLPATPSNLSGLFKYLTCFLQKFVLPLLFTIAGLVFIWGAVKFMGADDSSEKEEGQQFMVWGIIGLAVMFSIWGIIGIIGNTFGIQGVFPKVPVSPPGTIQ